MSPSELFPLRVEELSFVAGGNTLLDRVSFTLEAPGCTAVLGPNGAGKTLLLRLCHGLLTPHTGTIIWGTQTPCAARPAQSMVFQLPALLERSVRANVEYALKLQRVAPAERRVRTAEILEQCGLAAIATRPAQRLSGGERQKLALARALVRRPAVLLLDEPTSELDPIATADIEAMIGGVVAQGVHVLMTTHDMHQAKTLAHDIVFLDGGTLQAHLAAPDFFAQQGETTMHRFAARAGHST